MHKYIGKQIRKRVKKRGKYIYTQGQFGTF